MTFREIINGSFEPLWRKNAREDADRFRADMVKGGASRRRFLAEAGAVLMLGYLEQRRAIAFPFPPVRALVMPVTAPLVTPPAQGGF